MSPGRGSVPPGFASRRQRGHVVMLEKRLANALRDAGLLDPIQVVRLLADAQGATGRAATADVWLPGAEERLVLRGLRRGGLLGPLLGGALWGPGRPLRELRATAALRAAGAPVPRPVLALAWRRVGPLWNGAFATVREPHAVDALTFLEGGPQRRRIQAAARAAGHAVRRFHDVGGRHADLHVKNLLLREGRSAIEALVIDLDRVRCVSRVPPSRRMTELMRLYRSLRKRNLLERVGARGCAAFFHAYVAGDRPLRQALLRSLPRERRRVALHALRYRSTDP